jgi:hypothetical protein
VGSFYLAPPELPVIVFPQTHSLRCGLLTYCRLRRLCNLRIVILLVPEPQNESAPPSGPGPWQLQSHDSWAAR